MASKILTRDQAQARKDKAVRFAENVLDDLDKADEIEDEDLDDWAARKKIKLIDNPRERSSGMANSSWSKNDLLARIGELESENADLQDALDSIADIASPAMDEDEDEDPDGTDGDDQD